MLLRSIVSPLIAFKAMFCRVIIYTSPQGIIPSVYLSIRIINLNRTMRWSLMVNQTVFSRLCFSTLLDLIDCSLFERCLSAVIFTLSKKFSMTQTIKTNIFVTWNFLRNYWTYITRKVSRDVLKEIYFWSLF